MAPRKDEEQGAPTFDLKTLAEMIRNASHEDQVAFAQAAGLAPSTIGMKSEDLSTIMSAFTKVSANAQKEALKSQRKENPLYPERSVFNPRGTYDDDGNPQQPKLKFSRPTYFNHVKLGGELETEEEIQLFNSFTEDRYARDGTWKAEIVGQGVNQRLLVTVPSRTVDDRMGLPPLPLILRELLGGKEAVNPATLQKQIEAMKAEIEVLKAKGAAA